MTRISNYSRKIRAENRAAALDALPEIEKFVRAMKVRDSLGVHITLWRGAVRIDWWPGTGKFMRDDMPTTGRADVMGMICILGAIDGNKAPPDDEVIE